MKRILVIFAFAGPALAVEPSSVLSDYSLVGVISAGEVGTGNKGIAVIKDKVSKRTLTVRVGQTLPQAPDLTVQAISRQEVTLSDGETSFLLRYGGSDATKEQVTTPGAELTKESEEAFEPIRMWNYSQAADPFRFEELYGTGRRMIKTLDADGNPRSEPLPPPFVLPMRLAEDERVIWSPQGEDESSAEEETCDDCDAESIEEALQRAEEELMENDEETEGEELVE